MKTLAHRVLGHYFGLFCYSAGAGRPLRELYDYVNGMPCSKSTLATQIALQPNGHLIFVPIKQINKILNYLIKIYPHRQL